MENKRKIRVTIEEPFLLIGKFEKYNNVNILSFLYKYILHPSHLCNFLSIFESNIFTILNYLKSKKTLTYSDKFLGDNYFTLY